MLADFFSILLDLLLLPLSTDQILRMSELLLYSDDMLPLMWTNTAR